MFNQNLIIRNCFSLFILLHFFSFMLTGFCYHIVCLFLMFLLVFPVFTSVCSDIYDSCHHSNKSFVFKQLKLT